MKLPDEVVAVLDKLVVVENGKHFEDLSGKFMTVSSEVLSLELRGASIRPLTLARASAHGLRG